MKPIEDPAGAFTFSVPDDWEPSFGEDGNVCVTAPGQQSNVIVIAQPKQAASLDEQAEETRTAFQRAMPAWTPTAEEPREVSGRPALLIRAMNEIVGVKSLSAHLLVFTDEHEVTLSVSYPTSDAETMEAVAEQIVASLQLAGE